MMIAWDEEAWADYVAWQSEDKKIRKRINDLIKDIQRNGHRGIGKPEPLRYMNGGWWSRRIDEKKRLIYRIKEQAIEIIQCKGHYDD